MSATDVDVMEEVFLATDKFSPTVTHMASVVEDFEKKVARAKKAAANFGATFDPGANRWRNAQGQFTVKPTVIKPPIIPSPIIKGSSDWLSNFRSGLNNGVKFAGEVVQKITGVIAIGTAAIAGLGLAAKNAFEQFAEFDSLVQALNAIEGSAARATAALNDLKEIAKAPGIGFEESVKGYLMLRRSGMNAPFAEDLIKNAGNANATGGGSKEQFGRIMLALSQIAIKPFLSGEELRQLSEAGIGAPQMVKDKFGTADTEELKARGITSAQVIEALNESMRDMPKVAGGAQNSLDNLGSAFHFAVVNAGSGLAGAGKGLDELSDVLEKFTDAGIWKSAVEGFVSALGLVSPSTEEVEEALLEVTGSFVGFGIFLKNFFKELADWVEILLGPGPKLIRLLMRGDNAVSNTYKDFYGTTGKADWIEQQRAALAAQKDAKKSTLGIGSTPTDSGLDKDKPKEKVAKTIGDHFEMVKEKSLDLTQTILGGGALANGGTFSSTNMSRLLGSGAHSKTNTGNRELDKVIDALKDYHESIQHLIDAGQNATLRSNPLRA